MQGWSSVVVGVLCSAALVAGAYGAGGWGARRATPAPRPSASAVTPAVAAPTASANAPAEEPEPSLLPSPDDAADGGGRPLPPGAPSSVGFGVVLFTYQGVQFAPQGARTRQQALEKARSVIEEAKKDFAEAVKKGDRGSTADAGRIPRGVLEPEIEVVLFSLEKGAVHPEPIDTPRGFWVVRRID